MLLTCLFRLLKKKKNLFISCGYIGPHFLLIVNNKRELHFMSDALARIGSLQDSDILYYDSPPSNLLDVYLSDLYGRFHFKLCPKPDVVDPVS